MTDILLDSNAFLWASAEPHKLSKIATAAIGAAERRHLSVASAWEIAIKVGIGKLPFPIDEFDAELDALAVALLPISLERRAINLQHSFEP